MIHLSTVANSIQLSPVRDLFNKAKQYPDVVDLTLGDPDVQPHQAIKDAACIAIQEGKTRYSQNAGLLSLREAISSYYERKEQLYYDPNGEIMATVGAMEGLFLVLNSILNPGDEVLILAPYYVNYVQMITICHANPIIVDNPNSHDLMYSFEDIDSYITNRTRAIIINTPSNPTGRVLPQSVLLMVAELAKQHDLLVIADEVYKCLIYDSINWTSIAHFDGMRERTIIVNSLSKEFCMTGYRIGYVLGPSEVINTMTKLQENIAACAPLPSQYAAIKALDGKEDYSKEMKCVYSRRRKVLYDYLSKGLILRPILPEATFYMMVDISLTRMSSTEFAYDLLDKAHVAVVPGIAYGKCCDSFIRVAFTVDDAILRQGATRMTDYVESKFNNWV